jgi:hypothetical protein
MQLWSSPKQVMHNGPNLGPLVCLPSRLAHMRPRPAQLCWANHRPATLKNKAIFKR